MTAAPAQARVAWALCGLAVALAGVHTWLFLGWPVAREEPSGWPVLTLGLPLWVALGALVVSRRPGHRVGWLFVVGGVCSLIGNTLACYDLIATAPENADPPAIWALAAWVAVFLDVPEPLLFLTLLFLLFPTGHLPSSRWRPLAWCTWTSFGLFVLLLAVAVPPWRFEPGNREELFNGTVGRLAALLLVSMLLELLVAAGSVVVRARRARGVERQQLRWLAVSASMVAVAFALAAFLPNREGSSDWLRTLPLHLSVVAVVIGAGLAVLRYRLYDLDVAISRAILVTAATAIVAAGYVAVVVAVGRTAPAGVTDAFLPSLLATALVALAFQPLRRRLVRAADRLAYGRRAAPYEALADFARSLQQAPGLADLLPQVAGAVAEASGARGVRVALEVPNAPERVATWGVPADPPAGSATGGPGPLVVLPVADHDERLGRVELVMPAGRPLRPGERALVARLVDQSALALRQLRLQTELAARVDELGRRTTALAESRRRLVVARVEEKARFAAALDRRVLPHLAPLPDRLAAQAAASTAAGPEAVLDLATERAAATAALDELRRLVHGTGPGRGAGRSAQPVAADQAASSRSGPNADLVT